MRGWLLVGLLGCAGGAVDDDDMVGVWALERQLGPASTQVAPCDTTRTSRLVLDRNHEGLWLLGEDLPLEEAERCGAPPWGTQSVFLGRWYVYAWGDGHRFSFEATEQSYDAYDSEANALVPSTTFHDLVDIEFDMIMVRDDDDVGPFLYLDSEGLHRLVE